MIKVTFQINREDRLFNTPSSVIIWKKNKFGSPSTHCIKLYSTQIKYYHVKSETISVPRKIWVKHFLNILV